VTASKLFHSIEQQVALLEARGMDVGERERAADQLQSISYYRLSGYWYPFRRFVARGRADGFFPGTRLADVVSLHDFDASLRAMTFSALSRVELAVRASLGHALGAVDEHAHLRPDLLNSRAGGQPYDRWRDRYERELADSHEDFVEHHRAQYGSRLPTWAAVEILDWGGLTRLFGFSPRSVQDEVADAFGLRAPQLESWLKSLNIVRNVCAHHGRLFNRVFAITPKLPRPGTSSDLDSTAPFTRTFGQLTLIQHLLDARGLPRTGLPAVLRSYPAVQRVPIAHTGAPADWASSSLWS
jgi:abortive infection bacteriophage resistance protein